MLNHTNCPKNVDKIKDIIKKIDTHLYAQLVNWKIRYGYYKISKFLLFENSSVKIFIEIITRETPTFFF